MKIAHYRRLALDMGLVAVVSCFCVGRVAAQDRSLDPTFGDIKLKAGFLPDPFTKELTAGGAIETKLGGVKAKVANAPDFKLYYQAGKLPLTIRVESTADTTLLINLPDGTWVADDDSGGNLNPKLQFANPQSGRYDIWVGTYAGGLPKVKLIITEREGTNVTNADLRRSRVPRYLKQAADQLMALMTKAEGEGFRLERGMTLAGGWVDQGAKWQSLYKQTLLQGTTYRFIAAGDNDARDVDLRLLDEDGTVVANDVSTAQTAFFTFTPTKTAFYFLETRLYRSEENVPCIVLTGVYYKK